MRILVQLSVLCCVMFICGTASADERVMAGKLRDSCISKNDSAQLACAMYIAGFLDGHLAGLYGGVVTVLGPAAVDKIRGTDEDNLRFSFFCVPSAAKNGQVMEIFVKYMNEHPEKLHLFAGTQLTEALVQYFPCKQEMKGGAK